MSVVTRPDFTLVKGGGEVGRGQRKETATPMKVRQSTHLSRKSMTAAMFCGAVQSLQRTTYPFVFTFHKSNNQQVGKPSLFEYKQIYMFELRLIFTYHPK